jgi:hypothetical protein
MATDFRIANTFTASPAQLNGSGQKAAKTIAFDLEPTDLSQLSG